MLWRESFQEHAPFTAYLTFFFSLFIYKPLTVTKVSVTPQPPVQLYGSVCLRIRAFREHYYLSSVATVMQVC